MRILVTGGAGYVGSILVPQLLAQGHEVDVIDCLMYGGGSLLLNFSNPRFSLTKGDIREYKAVRQAVQKVDAVIHLAAIVGFPAYRKTPRVARKTNVRGTRNVVAALSRQQILIYASTGSNYDKLDDVCTEESPLNPISLYGITKVEAERFALEAEWSTALRFATAFGVSPRLRLDLLVNDFVYQAVVNRQIIVYERGFRRTFINVRDMARSFLFALEHIDRMKNMPFNIGHESLNFTKEEVVRKVRERIPFYLHFAEVGNDADKRDYEVSYERIRDLGFETTITVDEGIDELIRAMTVVEVRSPYTNI